MTTFSALSKLSLGTLTFLFAAFSAQAQKRQILITTVQHIASPPEQVFDVLSDLNRFSEWSPFLVSDPEQKYHVTGESGKVGSTFHWEGVAEKSLGSQTLTAMTETSTLRMDCDIQQPFAGAPIFEYQLKETESGTEVTQTFTLQLSGFSYLMTKIFGVEKQMTTTNQLGMTRLKELLENGKAVAGL